MIQALPIVDLNMQGHQLRAHQQQADVDIDDLVVEPVQVIQAGHVSTHQLYVA